MNLCQTKLQKTNNRGNAMITILGDFWPFSAAKMAFFITANVMIQISQKQTVFWSKKRHFTAIFMAKLFF
jgi:hypothetical protein